MSITASHSIVCNAPRATVFALIRDSARWPAVFEPCLSVEVLEAAPNFERIKLTALVGGVAMTWESRRHFSPEACAIDSTLSPPMPLVRAMTTSWRVAQINTEQCLLVLEHCYEMDEETAGKVAGVDSAEQARRFIAAAIDTNSTTELGNIKAAVEGANASADQVALDQRSSISVVCEAPAASVYAVIRDTANWPRIFDACVKVTRLGGEGIEELVRIEAMQEGHLVAWNTQRTYHDEIKRIDYHLPVPMPFLESMQGQWRVVALGAERCLLSVDRQWRLLGDVRGIRAGVETVAQASAIFDAFVNENARAEMQAIRSYVEGGNAAFASYTNRWLLPCEPDAVYALLADVSAWPERLPHCKALEIAYDDGHYQEFSMQVETPRGVETFRSIRRCSAESLTITYFQPEPPAVLRTHHGSWHVKSAPGGAEVIAQHSVELDVGACVAAFGDADVVLHKKRIKELLAANSGRTVAALRAQLGAAPAVSLGAVQ